MKTQTFGRTLTGALCLERKFFLICFFVQIGAWALCLGVLAIIDLVTQSDPPVIGIGLPGLFAVCAGGILTYLEGISQFNTFLAVQITFGISRRRALLSAWVVTLGCGAVTMVLAAVQEAIWFYPVTGGAGEEIIGGLPAWGWLCLAFLPGAAAAFTMGFLRRFGRKGGVALWLMFMVLCQTPQLVQFSSGELLSALAAAMPVLLPLTGLAAGAAGSLLLYRASAVITNR